MNSSLIVAIIILIFSVIALIMFLATNNNNLIKNNFASIDSKLKAVQQIQNSIKPTINQSFNPLLSNTFN